MEQHVVVMRHGERRDNVEPLWAARASRRWDPPLTDDGKAYAFKEGRHFLGRYNFSINRVIVSPFLRCLQTANEVVSALRAVDYDPTAMLSSSDVTIDPSKIKVSVEYGLCEMMNSIAIRPEMAPKDGDFGFDVSRCEASLPAGTIDHSTQMVYNELPKWEETVTEARTRYIRVIKALADKYPSENLLLVTHGEGVGTAFSSFKQGCVVYDLDYCGTVHAKRDIFLGQNQSFTAAGDLSYVGHSGILFNEAISN